MKNINFLIFVLFLSLCSPPSNEGVASLSGDITTTSIIEEEDYPIVLTQCLNEEKGYNLATPFDIQDLKTTISQLSNSKEEELQLGEDVNYCINKYNLWSSSETTNPDELAKMYDNNLELAMCLREKGLKVPDPSQQEPKLDLSELEESKDEITSLLEECGYDGKKVNNKYISLLFLLLLSACSNPEETQGVLSTKDLSTETTFMTIQEEIIEIEISVEDAELLLARCLRDRGYDVRYPQNEEGLRGVLTPIFIALDQQERQELFQNIQSCAEENNIPLGDDADFEDPDVVAERLDTELEFAQCLRGKGIDVEDPSSERPLRPILVGLVMSGQYPEAQIRSAAGECFDDLGLDPPQNGQG